VGQGLSFSSAIYLQIAGAYGSDFQRRTTFTSDMAQTYNQKKNVYSIDQILGHDKDGGTVKYLSFFYQRNTRKLFV